MSAYIYGIALSLEHRHDTGFKPDAAASIKGISVSREQSLRDVRFPEESYIRAFTFSVMQATQTQVRRRKIVTI